MSKITLYFLQGSRAIRIAWLLEELSLNYDIKYAEREKGQVPPAFVEEAGGIGMFPTLRDGDVVLHESSNITEYLCDTYDKEHKLLPPVGNPLRYKMLFWIHAAEGTYTVHAVPIVMARWYQQGEEAAKTEELSSANVVKDMDYLEKILVDDGGKFLGGNSITAADCMMHFSVMFVVMMRLGIGDRKYERAQRYVQDCEATESFKKAVAKTGWKIH